MKPFTRFAPALLSLLLAFTAGCRLKDVRTVPLQANGVRCEACARAAIRSLAAIGEVSPEQDVAVDPAQHTAVAVWKDHARNNTAAISKVVVHYDSGEIDVTYDSMKLAIKNLEFAIANAGFTVQSKPYDIPGNAAARATLPEACRNH